MLKVAVFVSLIPICLKLFLDYPFAYDTPKILQDDFFGSCNTHADDETISEFSINIDQSAIDNFKEVINRSRSQIVPDLEYSSDVQFGFSTAYLKNVSDIMLKFDWKQHQYFLNTFPQHRTEIEGLRIHFIRAAYPQTYKRIFPLLLIHSWPSTFWEFYKVIPILINPNRFGFDFGETTRFAFEVVVPSLPGFAFSDKPSKPGLGVVEAARIMAKLMKRIGFTKYFVHGHGQLGCAIADTIALSYADSVQGLHVGNPSMMNFLSSQFIIKRNLHELFTALFTFDLRPHIFNAYASNKDYLLNDFHLTALSKSLGISLLDSALGMTAFVLDRWALATDVDYALNGATQLHKFFTVDDFLTNVFICWLTKTLPYGSRLLINSVNQTHSQMFRASVVVATSVMIGSNSPRKASKSLLQYRYHNITRYVAFKGNGEFIALQSPNYFAEDIFSFVEQIVR